jgi:phosphoribosylanthranilate isomerase
MFRIKICGITNVEDALAAAEAGADAIGLNFFEQSPRHVSRETALQIAAVLPKNLKKVGVFVNATPSEIRSLHQDLSFDLVQLHGDEPPELLSTLIGIPVIRAFRSDGNWAFIQNYLLRCTSLNCSPALVLIDAYSKSQYGGTGETANWSALGKNRPLFGQLPIVLAGGLRPENVAHAIETAMPQAVDTASGVEISPGHKSLQQMQAFVAAAQTAFDLTGESGYARGA